MLWVRCPVLYVCDVRALCTVGQIKMKLGTQVGLVPGHTVLDWDTAPPRKGAHQPATYEIYGSRLCLRPYNMRSMPIVAKTQL